MVILYWAIPKDQTDQGIFWITSEGDVLPLDYFQTWNDIASFVYQGDVVEYKGKTILLIHSVVPDNSIQALAEEVGGNPMTIAAMEQLKISRFYGGSSIPEFKERLLLNWGFDLPETREVDGEIVPFLIPSSMGPA